MIKIVEWISSCFWRRIKLALLCLLYYSTFIHAQVIPDSVYNDNIHTVQLHKAGWELSYPIINLKMDEKLKISFDDLSTENKNYYYTIVHCNSNWETEDISFFEYAEGFEMNPIMDYSYSTNTVVNYVHYSFTLPNQSCTPTISGNYMLKVFEGNDPGKLIFSRKFFVVENAADINFSIIRPEIARYMMKYQQYKLAITPNIDGYYDLRTEIKALVFQNFNLTLPKTCYLTELINNKTLVYDNPDSNLFEGGNEFRNFDIKSIKYQSIHIKSIVYQNNCFNVILHPDEWRNKKQYFTDIDLNGKFYIENSIGVNKDRDADYVLVHFNLPSVTPLVDGNIYVVGALFNWQCNAFSKMTYNFDTHAYEFHALLKQGYYTYQYAMKSGFDNVTDFAYVEGRHYETENDYQIFVYYRAQGARYERLIGYEVANSLNK